MKRAVLLSLILWLGLFCMSSGQKRQTHDLRFSIKGMQDSAVLLIYYYGSQQYIKDTIPLVKEKLTLKGDSLLRTGMYAFVDLQKQHLFDFFVDKDEQQFSLSTTRENIVDDMTVKNSVNNAKFYEWVKLVNKSHAVSDSLKDMMVVAQEQNDSSRVEAVKQQFDILNKEVVGKQKELFEKTPGLLVSRFMKAQEDVQIPATKPDGSEADNRYRYDYAKKHYFDNFSLSDEALLYTSIYDKKVDWFLKNMVVPTPDSLIYDAEKLIQQAKQGSDTYKYMVWKATSYAERSEVMGMDKAFVYFVDNYYAHDESLTISDARKRLMKRAGELRGSLIGGDAPNMIMQDSAWQLRDLSKISTDFVLLYFFDPDCGHCRTTTDTLIALYKKHKKVLNFEVFAVCSDTSMIKMKNYINDKQIPWIVVNGPRTVTKPYGMLYDVPSLPAMYLIDKKKTIIAKRLSAPQMIDVMQRYAETHY